MSIPHGCRAKQPPRPANVDPASRDLLATYALVRYRRAFALKPFLTIVFYFETQNN